MSFNRKGVTLVELLIVVGIIGMLAAMAMPNFLTARASARKNICIANMRQIRNAVEMWATEEDKESGDMPTTDDLVPDYIKSWPTERGTAYAVPAVGETPTCPHGTSGHTL